MMRLDKREYETMMDYACVLLLKHNHTSVSMTKLAIITTHIGHKIHNDVYSSFTSSSTCQITKWTSKVKRINGWVLTDRNEFIRRDFVPYDKTELY